MNSADFTKQSPGHLELIPEGVDAFVPDPLPPPRAAFDPMPCCQMAEQAAMSLGGLRGLVATMPNSNLLIDSFLRREAIRSSKIEGTKTELGELLLFELGEPADEATSEDAEQVEGNLKAFMAGLQQVESTPLYGGLFRSVHAVLFERANRLRPGEFRNASTRIGGTSFDTARFVPTPARYIDPAMKDLDEFINIPEKHASFPVLIQLALMHYQFETVHPFCDGNGRIGRLAISLLLKVRGLLPKPILCLSAYMDDHREEYTDRMLAVSQRGKWTEWVQFFLRAIKEQAEDDIARCRRLIALRDTYLELCDSKKIPVAVVDQLFRFPITTIQRVADTAGTTFAPASRCVEALVGAGVLVEVTKRKTHRIYLSQPIVDLLEKPLEET